MAQADLDRDGMIDYKEFVSQFKKAVPASTKAHLLAKTAPKAKAKTPASDDLKRENARLCV